MQIYIGKKDELNISRKRVNVDDRKILDKASTSTLDISLFDEFYLYVGEFKMHHKKKVIIENIFTSTILLNITLVSFNYISKSSKVINIPGYLDFLKQKNLDMNNPLSIDKSNLYEEVILIKFYDIFQIVIYQCDKIIMSPYDITNIIFRSRYPSANLP